MLVEYLNDRKKIMENIIKDNSEKLDHNIISIIESKKKINELENLIDEASEIFSTKARVDSEHKNQEITDMKIKICALDSENEILKENIENATKELKVINDSIDEFQKNYVSRETKYKRRRPSIKREVIDKLRFCKEINSVDNIRVSIELDEILKLLS
jgi:chromosome segregation ATPase